MKCVSLPLLLLSTFIACSKSGGKPWADVPLAEGRVTLMTYNVENLFDIRHDHGKSDRTYLPLSAKKTAEHAAHCGELRRSHRREQCLGLDWSEEVLKLKLARLSGVILSVGGDRGPDILVLQEVENIGVLERLRALLAPAGYRPGVLIEGGDRRGIDVAVLTRMPSAGEPRLHRPRRSGARGILEVPLLMPDGSPLTLFALHLSAPAGPRESREEGLRLLNRLLGALPAGRMVVAAGDFNITAGEDAAYRILDRLAAPRWLVSHRFGCADCRGTNYYSPKNDWSFLDMILLSGNLHPSGGTPWVVLRDSVRVIEDAPQQKDRRGAPARFDPEFGTGVSDHWPLMLTLAEREEISRKAQAK